MNDISMLYQRALRLQISLYPYIRKTQRCVRVYSLRIYLYNQYQQD